MKNRIPTFGINHKQSRSKPDSHCDPGKLVWFLKTISNNRGAIIGPLLVLTALSDGSRCGEVPVLSVHVVGAAAGVIAQPDAEVLHLQRRLLVDLTGKHDERLDAVRVANKEKKKRGLNRDSPGHSRRSLRMPSSSSSAERQSTRSEIWPRCGSGQRSSSGREGGRDS